jgi:hypothetical protein
VGAWAFLAKNFVSPALAVILAAPFDKRDATNTGCSGIIWWRPGSKQEVVVCMLLIIENPTTSPAKLSVIVITAAFRAIVLFD